LARVGRLGLISIAVVVVTLIFSGVAFLFDPTFGGRTDYLANPGPITFLPPDAVGNFAEVVYFSALSMLGISGLIAIILLFFAPLFLAASFKELRQTRVQIAALSGLLLYVPLAAMDGALNYIPTMAFYWFLWMLLIYTGHFKNGNTHFQEIRRYDQIGTPTRDTAGWA
jgi:hypothetical protein